MKLTKEKLKEIINEELEEAFRVGPTAAQKKRNAAQVYYNNLVGEYGLKDLGNNQIFLPNNHPFAMEIKEYISPGVKQGDLKIAVQDNGIIITHGARFK